MQSQAVCTHLVSYVSVGCKIIITITTITTIVAIHYITIIVIILFSLI